VPDAPLADARRAVADAARLLAGRGLCIGTAGNISVRADSLVAVTATGVVLAETTPELVTVVDLAGSVVAGGFAPTSELELHLGIYRRHGAGAVVHTHAPRSTAVACVLGELPVIHYQQLALGGATPVVPFYPFGTTELAEAVATALAGRQAALLSNHGAVTHAPTLSQAVEHALLLEWACGLYADAAALGTPRTLSTDQQAAVLDVVFRREYGTTKTLPPLP
jgi:L-fuculose-phosphate aldolase